MLGTLDSRNGRLGRSASGLACTTMLLNFKTALTGPSSELSFPALWRPGGFHSRANVTEIVVDMSWVTYGHSVCLSIHEMLPTVLTMLNPLSAIGFSEGGGRRTGVLFIGLSLHPDAQ